MLASASLMEAVSMLRIPIVVSVAALAVAALAYPALASLLR
jgi:hypothetical protein